MERHTPACLESKSKRDAQESPETGLFKTMKICEARATLVNAAALCHETFELSRIGMMTGP